MSSLPEQMRARTKRFALDVVGLFRLMPKTDEARIIGKQLLRAGTSVAANYRAACRARSRAEFIAKIGTVIEKSDEPVFWLELLRESGIVTKNHTESLLAEANELLAIFAASSKTAKIRRDSLH